MANSRHGGKVVAALFALSGSLLAALAGVFLMIQSVFPWMTVLNPRESAENSGGSETAATVVNVTEGGPTVAEVALKRVMRADVPSLSTDGWSEIAAGAGVPGVSFGFGCDPTDGLSPVVAEGRAWVQARQDETSSVSRATATLDVSARAYPAGGGAVAFAGMSAAVLACDAASLVPTTGLGVDVAKVVTDDSLSMVWRRGDVLMVGTVTGRSREDSATYLPVFETFDAALDKELDDVCVNQSSVVADARRSPYVNREDFFGAAETDQVKRPKKGQAPAAETLSTYPVVPVPAEPVTVPASPFLPTAPDPAITDGPTALPEPVEVPTMPVIAVQEPADVVAVEHKIADPTGPGCGWEFTAQRQPGFDQATADADYTEAVREARKQLTAKWGRWQEAKLVYYADYAEYRSAAQAYRDYVSEVAEVSEAWARVETARAAYFSALDAYTAAVEALAQFKVDRASAREGYVAARLACRNRPDEPEVPEVPDSPQSPESPDGGAGPDAGTEGDTGTPGPRSSPRVTPPDTSGREKPKPSAPEMVCPPVRPTILDQAPPTVPPLPVPAPEAQLPTEKQAPESR